MWNCLYQGLLLVAWPWVRLRLAWRARREPEYGRRVDERFGRVPPDVAAGSVWFHTVSAGETIAAAPLIGALGENFAGLPLLVTTMTPTGSAQVRARLGDRVSHCYAPYDFPWVVRRFFERVRPSLLVLMETELWPNLIGEAARRDVPVLLVNARLSERSARGYRRLGSLTRTMLQRLRWVACQYPELARRFVELGAPTSRVLVHGSVKFDVALPADHSRRVAALRARWALDDAPVWIAASTHPGEETAVLAAHRRIVERVPGTRLLLVPRHPARAAEVMAQVRAAGWSCVRQSTPEAADAQAEVVLGDTMGELLYLYALADVAFVGGSLNGGGGHNPIEPALCALPVLMGRNVFNFPDVVAAFEAAGSLRLVPDATALADAAATWLADDATRHRLGAAGRGVIEAQRGASGRLRDLLEAEIRGAAGGNFCQARIDD
jgi:3-deoxy-D-manno-octulosonic-acid transferase